jgi:hypothetical protein
MLSLRQILRSSAQRTVHLPPHFTLVFMGHHHECPRTIQSAPHSLLIIGAVALNVLSAPE